MYNRYIPQADGSYRRSRVPDFSPRPNPYSPPPAPSHLEEQPSEPPCCDTQNEQHPRCSRCSKKTHPAKTEPRYTPTSNSIGTFLRQLLPRNFDTGDLLVVLLLLLMSCDCPDDQNTALLTLALYLFM